MGFVLYTKYILSEEVCSKKLLKSAPFVLQTTITYKSFTSSDL